MDIINTKELSIEWKREILNLWNCEYPLKMSYNSLDEFDEYLNKLGDQNHTLFFNSENQIKAWYVDFIRDEERFFAIILDSEEQGKGYGSIVLNLAKENNHELNAWVIDHENDKKQNGEPYRSPLNFYVKNAFEVLPEVRLEVDKISAVKIRWRRNNSF